MPIDRRGRPAGFLLVGLIMILGFSCRHKEVKVTDAALLFSADSARIDQLFVKYKCDIDSNYAVSRMDLRVLLDAVDSLPVGHQKLSIQFFSKISMFELGVSNFSLADSLSTLALKRAYDSGDEEYYDIAHQGRGVYFFYQGQNDSADYHYQKSLFYAEKTMDIDQILSAKGNLATLGMRNDDHQKSIANFSEVIDLCEKHGKWNYMAISCNNLAGVYYHMGELFNALKYYLEAMDILEKVNSKQDYLMPMNNVAAIYEELGMQSQALDQFEKVKALASELKDNDSFINASINIALIQCERKQFDRSITLLDSVLIFLKENKFPVSEEHVACYSSLGNSYLDKGDLLKAKSYLKKAISLSDSLGFNPEFVYACDAISKVYFQENNYDSLSYYASLTKKMATKHNIRNSLMSSSYYLAKTNEKRNRLGEALNYFDDYYQYASSGIDSLSTQKAKDFAYYYELQRAETEKELLQKDNQLKEAQNHKDAALIRIQQNTLLFGAVLLVSLLVVAIVYVRQSRKLARLNALLNEENDFKSNLISIVSHDIRSPLVSLYSMFLLLREENLNKADRDRLETQLLERSEKTINLIDNLLFWTHEQLRGGSMKPESFNVHALVKSIRENEVNKRVQNQILFVNHVPESLVINSDKNVVHLTFRNLIVNAFKFTPVGGRIEARAEVREKDYLFSVCDNGVGISPENQGKVLNESEAISVKGLHGEKGKGFGLLLCKYFVQKCGGNIWFDSEPGKGTSFYFSIPHPPGKG